MQKTPITIFSGYLGSGKTTIIRNALQSYTAPVKFAMIKNEFGDASVDGTLMQLQNLAVKELVNGCLCCILVGSLNDAVNELIEKEQPDRIIIEASGNALPFPILLELKKNPNIFVDGVISVVDCVNFDRVKDTSIVAREQAKYTDLIIFNKIDSINAEKLYQVKEEIFGINPDTVKIETADGKVDPNLLFGINHHDLIAGTIELHDHHLESFTIMPRTDLDQQKLTQVLDACQKDSFYRIKGIVTLNNHQTMLVNYVFGQGKYEPINTETIPSRLIFIGKDILKHQSIISDYIHQAELQ